MGSPGACSLTMRQPHSSTGPCLVPTGEHARATSGLEPRLFTAKGVFSAIAVLVPLLPGKSAFQASQEVSAQLRMLEVNAPSTLPASSHRAPPRAPLNGVEVPLVLFTNLDWPNGVDLGITN